MTDDISDQMRAAGVDPIGLKDSSMGASGSSTSSINEMIEKGLYKVCFPI